MSTHRVFCTSRTAGVHAHGLVSLHVQNLLPQGVVCLAWPFQRKSVLFREPLLVLRPELQPQVDPQFSHQARRSNLGHLCLFSTALVCECRCCCLGVCLVDVTAVLLPQQWCLMPLLLF